MLPTLNSACLAGLMRTIELRRLALNVTPEELARQAGLNRRAMNACLTGHTEISVRLLARIAAALDLTLQLTPVEKEPDGRAPAGANADAAAATSGQATSAARARPSNPLP